MTRSAFFEAISCLVLLALGAAVVMLAPTSRLPYVIGCAFLAAGAACLIDLIVSPGEPPDRVAIAIVTAAGILVGGW